MQFRIGDRDPVTGLYDVIHPDGSFTPNGIKIFNSVHEFGDVVLATERSDGMMILDGVKATVSSAPLTDRFGLGGFGEKPVGYLNGQVFNNEEEVTLPTASIEFAPGSPEELEPGAGDFVVRIKIDRPQRKDLRVKCELSGTAGSGDYSVVGLDSDFIAIVPAGVDFFDITITPIQNQSGTDLTVIVKAIEDRAYRISQSNGDTATIASPVIALPVVSINFAPGSPVSLVSGTGSFVFRVSVSLVQSNPIAPVISLSGSVPNGGYTATGLSSGTIIIPAGELFSDFTVTPSGGSGNIIASIATSPAYTIDQGSQTATVTPPVIAPIYRISRAVAIVDTPTNFVNKIRIGGRSQDAGKQIAIRFKSVNTGGGPVPVVAPLVVNYLLQGGLSAYIALPNTTVIGAFRLGSVTIPTGSSEAVIYLDPIISSTTGGTITVSVDPGNQTSYISVAQSVTAEIETPAIARVIRSVYRTSSQNQNPYYSFDPIINQSLTFGGVAAPQIGNALGTLFVMRLSDIYRPIFISLSGNGLLGSDYEAFFVEEPTQFIYPVLPPPINNITTSGNDFFVIKKLPGLIGTKQIVVEVVADIGYDIGTPFTFTCNIA